ncbi:MAG: hypothetical protein GY703_12220 [Gammaproteobacteria bacterium]|nr:hypothetical protein [Gammaproteobacteria bacterium]
MNFLDALIGKNSRELPVIQPRPKSLFEPEQDPTVLPTVPIEKQENSGPHDISEKTSGVKVIPGAFHPAQETGKTINHNPQPETDSGNQVIRTNPEGKDGLPRESETGFTDRQVNDMAGKEKAPVPDSPAWNPVQNTKPEDNHTEPAPLNQVRANEKGPELDVIVKPETIIYSQLHTWSAPLNQTPVSPLAVPINRGEKRETPQASNGVTRHKSGNHAEPAPLQTGRNHTTDREPSSRAPFFPKASKTLVDKEPWNPPVPPKVTISIGTIEIRAGKKQPVHKPSGDTQVREPVLALDDYLRQVNGDQK